MRQKIPTTSEADENLNWMFDQLCGKTAPDLLDHAYTRLKAFIDMVRELEAVPSKSTATRLLEHRRKIIMRMAADGHNGEQIAAHLGLSVHGLRGWMKAHGIYIRPRVRWTKEMDAELLRMFEAGKSIWSIGRAMCLNDSVIKSRLRRTGKIT